MTTDDILWVCVCISVSLSSFFFGANYGRDKLREEIFDATLKMKDKENTDKKPPVVKK